MRGLPNLSLCLLMMHQVAGFAITNVKTSVCRPPGHQSQLARLSNMALWATSGDKEQSNAGDIKKLRILALHGSEGNGLEFSVKLYPIRDVLMTKDIDLQVLALSAPFEKGRGYAWWTMPKGVRSFNADEYIGVDESTETVLKPFSPPFDPPDLVVAHSQGAILLAALLAQNLVPQHPKIGYILNGVAWPNPYGEHLFKLKEPTSDGIKSPRALFVMGDQDFVNPTESAKQVQDCLEKAGFQVSVHNHDGGHSLPDDDASVQAMADWILEEA